MGSSPAQARAGRQSASASARRGERERGLIAGAGGGGGGGSGGGGGGGGGGRGGGVCGGGGGGGQAVPPTALAGHAGMVDLSIWRRSMNSLHTSFFKVGSVTCCTMELATAARVKFSGLERFA